MQCKTKSKHPEGVIAWHRSTLDFLGPHAAPLLLRLLSEFRGAGVVHYAVIALSGRSRAPMPRLVRSMTTSSHGPWQP